MEGKTFMIRPGNRPWRMLTSLSVVLRVSTEDTVADGGEDDPESDPSYKPS